MRSARARSVASSSVASCAARPSPASGVLPSGFRWRPRFDWRGQGLARPLRNAGWLVMLVFTNQIGYWVVTRLSTTAGRAALVDEVTAASGGTVDAVVAPACFAATAGSLRRMIEVRVVHDISDADLAELRDLLDAVEAAASELETALTAAVDKPSPANLDAARTSMRELTDATNNLSRATSDSC